VLTGGAEAFSGMADHRSGQFALSEKDRFNVFLCLGAASSTLSDLSFSSAISRASPLPCDADTLRVASSLFCISLPG